MPFTAVSPQDSAAAMLVTTPAGRLLEANPAALRLLELEQEGEAWRGLSLVRCLRGRDADAEGWRRLRAQWRRGQGAAQGGGGDVTATDATPGATAPAPATATEIDLLLYTAGGRPRWVRAAVSRLPGRRRVGIVAVDITVAKLHEALQRPVLEAVMRDRPLAEVMDLLCREVEHIAPEVVASVIAVKDGRLRPLAAPSLPASVAAAIDGLPIGPTVGSCGAAAHQGTPVMVEDIATDPRWTPYRHWALALGLVGCWSSPILASDGHVLGTFAFYYRAAPRPTELHRRMVDLSAHLCSLLLQRDRASNDLQRLAHHDPLTGLANATLLRAGAARVLHDALAGGHGTALMLVDVTRLARVNEVHGHAAGDMLLRELGERLRRVARETDVLARLAGDEFVLVLPQCGASQAAAAAERVLEALAEPCMVGGHPLQPGASIGIALAPADGGCVEALLHHAGLACRQAKASGRQRFRFFDAAMDQAVQERAMLESDLQAALRDDTLELHYQPQVRGEPGAPLCGVEALLRWRHPRLGPVAPPRFVALAEDCGLIGALGRWVLRRALRQLAAWWRAGVGVPRVAVNLSPRNFEDPALVDDVTRLLAETGVAPGALTLEVTEGVLLERNPAVLQALEALHALGVVLSIDDFGTGYSSLSYLHRLPIGELKLDRSFVQDLETSPAARALTRAVLGIGASLRMAVVAEGVETAAQRRLLEQGGCPVLQGWLFAPALAPEALALWLAQREAEAGTGAASNAAAPVAMSHLSHAPRSEAVQAVRIPAAGVTPPEAVVAANASTAGDAA